MCEILKVFLETGQHWKFKDEYVQVIDFGDRDEEDIGFLKEFMYRVKFTIVGIETEEKIDYVVASEFRIDGIHIQDDGNDWLPMRWVAEEFVILCERDPTWE